ncbi:hypothetical protein LJ725_11335 [Reyranella aquatilis]|uniref:Uncharacterized protein n=1 Tax=Reyranella aquatilis TaxID=2035356 RepID=A0ABS8KU03_9HYPH|nr:hypothetical protein [Reyranella aquatilis]MCC8429562.1 hypothetical protein [Reyranella aquatilis]
MTTLGEAWAALETKLRILQPLPLSREQWSVIHRLHSNFNDREAQTRLPIPIARFGKAAVEAIGEEARRCDGVQTEYVDDGWFAGKFVDGPSDQMASYARLYNADVDRMIEVLFPAARYRKGHYAFGKFTVPQPHGLHTDHSAEDPSATGEPICIARIGTLGTHYVAGDIEAYDARTRSMLNALRYWTSVPEGEPEAVFGELLEKRVLATIPVDHVVLMVAGNGSPDAHVTQHIAARPPAGGVHSAFFQRQYRFT